MTRKMADYGSSKVTRGRTNAACAYFPPRKCLLSLMKHGQKRVVNIVPVQPQYSLRLFLDPIGLIGAGINGPSTSSFTTPIMVQQQLRRPFAPCLWETRNRSQIVRKISVVDAYSALICHSSYRMAFENHRLLIQHFKRRFIVRYFENYWRSSNYLWTWEERSSGVGG